MIYVQTVQFTTNMDYFYKDYCYIQTNEDWYWLQYLHYITLWPISILIPRM